MAETYGAIVKRGSARQETLVALAHALVDFALANQQLFLSMFGQIETSAWGLARKHRANDCFGFLVEAVYGEKRLRPKDPAWSHEHCADAYAYASFLYGLATLITLGRITFGPDAEKERREFVTRTASCVASSLPCTQTANP